jgi:hypothetical protein
MQAVRTMLEVMAVEAARDEWMEEEYQRQRRDVKSKERERK